MLGCSCTVCRYPYTWPAHRIAVRPLKHTGTYRACIENHKRTARVVATATACPPARCTSSCKSACYMLLLASWVNRILRQSQSLLLLKLLLACRCHCRLSAPASSQLTYAIALGLARRRQQVLHILHAARSHKHKTCRECWFMLSMQHCACPVLIVKKDRRHASHQPLTASDKSVMRQSPGAVRAQPAPSVARWMQRP